MEKKNNFVAYGFALVANLISFISGICWAWSSPAIPKLNGSVQPEQNPLATPITVLEASWITSLCNLGAATGPLLATALIDRVGRKNTLLYFSLPVIISYIWLIFAKTVIEICVARFLMGITTGCSMSLIPIYISELAEKENRGSMGIIMFLQMTFAQLLVFIMSPFVSLKVINCFALVPIVLFILLLTLFVPESPYYFALRGDVKKAEESLRSLRKRHDVKKELMEVVECVEESKRFGKPGFQDLYKNKTTMKAFFISMMLMLLQQGTAISPMFLYLQTIFDSTGTIIPGYITAIIVGAVAFSIVFISATTRLIDKVDRKILLITSEITIASVLVSLGLFFYLKDNNYKDIVETIFWLPVVSIVLYFLAFNFGMGPVIWQIMGEIFQANIKSLAATICTSFNIALGFLISLVFPTLSVYLTMAVCFWIFAALTALGAVFIYCVVPETRNKSFLEIQRILRGEKN